MVSLPAVRLRSRCCKSLENPIGIETLMGGVDGAWNTGLQVIRKPNRD